MDRYYCISCKFRQLCCPQKPTIPTIHRIFLNIIPEPIATIWTMNIRGTLHRLCHKILSTWTFELDICTSFLLRLQVFLHAISGHEDSWNNIIIKILTVL